MSQRFSYVKYDEESQTKQELLKKQFEVLEAMVDTLTESRPKALCLTALEEAYMWTGKAIRDEQISRNSQTAHVPERG